MAVAAAESVAASASASAAAAVAAAESVAASASASAAAAESVAASASASAAVDWTPEEPDSKNEFRHSSYILPKKGNKYEQNDGRQFVQQRGKTP